MAPHRVAVARRVADALELLVLRTVRDVELPRSLEDEHGAERAARLRFVAIVQACGARFVWIAAGPWIERPDQRLRGERLAVGSLGVAREAHVVQVRAEERWHDPTAVTQVGLVVGLGEEGVRRRHEALAQVEIVLQGLVAGLVGLGGVHGLFRFL